MKQYIVILKVLFDFALEVWLSIINNPSNSPVISEKKMFR